MDNLQLFLSTPQLHHLAGFLGRTMDGIRLRAGVLNDAWSFIAAGNGTTSVPEFAAPDNNLRWRSRARCVPLSG